MKGLFTVVLIVGAFMVGASPVYAADPDQTQERPQAREQERVYGWQLMTPEERAEHRAKMRSLKAPEEREAYRREHHEKMKERAKEKGVVLPDEPPARGMGLGRGGR